MGPDADCDRCGCIVPFYLKQRTERKYILQEVWGDLKGLIRGKPHATHTSPVSLAEKTEALELAFEETSKKVASGSSL